MSAFAEYLHEIFELIGTISTRRMFGGYGVYRDGVMFRPVAKDTLVGTRSVGTGRANPAGLYPDDVRKMGAVKG